jgi:hypothetical protein
MKLQEWLSALSDELDLADVEVTEELVTTLLDVARDAAHEVERVAAPLTTFLVGVAVGRGADLATTASRTTNLLLSDPSPTDG